MAYFAGLDVSVKETSVCIVDDAEAQHPNFQLSTSWQADYPIFRSEAELGKPPAADRAEDEVVNRSPYPLTDPLQSGILRCAPGP